MAFGALANTLMLDFKCVINPYQIYIHNRHWAEARFKQTRAHVRIDKTLAVMLELTMHAARSLLQLGLGTLSSVNYLMPS